jgi:hypothetical protein
MDRRKAILLVGGQNPLELYKITPKEIPGFEDLKTVRVTDHIPAWREIEAERERTGLNEQRARRFSPPDAEETPVTRPDSACGDARPERYSRDRPAARPAARKPEITGQQEIALPIQSPVEPAPHPEPTPPPPKPEGAEQVAPEYQVHKDIVTTDDLMNYFK